MSHPLIEKFQHAGQAQVFSFFPQLSSDAQRRLLAEAAEIDLDEVARLTRTLLAKDAATGVDLTGLAPAPYERRPEHGGDAAAWAQAKAAGEAALRAGRVSAFTVAGGQGTRLGYDGLDRDWEPIGAGGESGMTAGDPLRPGFVYGGTGQCFDLEANAPVPGTTQPVGPEPSRGDWTQPLVISHADPRAMYYASQFLFKSTDRARSWTVVSPDLTRADPGVPPNLDAAAAAQADRNGKRGVIYAVAPSPLLVPMVWVGTDDGLIHVTTNDGRSWQNVTPPALNGWSRVTCVEASHVDFNVAYASVDRHQLGDFEPYVYRTRDLGRTWQRIITGLPRGVYVHAIKEDPSRPGLLFAGTERGAHISLDDGDTWQPLQSNLPATSVRDLEIYGNDLIVATHGRGFWVMDDISALRQVSDAVLAGAAYLFKPADAINVTQGGDNGTPLQKDEPQAQNPASGAAIDYYLRADATGPVTLEILDAGGAVLRTLSADAPAGQAGGRAGRAGGIPNTSPLWRAAPSAFPTTAGLHRVFWNPVAGGGAGGAAGGGGFGRGGSVTLLTGTFTARLKVGEQSYSQSFVVKPDPRGR